MVLTIGNFDGVHRGHAALLHRAGERGAKVTALVFDPHPAAVLVPRRAPARLSTFAQRERWLKAPGAAHVHRLDPADGTLELSPAAFIDRLRAQFDLKAIVEGEDFRFGKGRAGDVRTLIELGRSRGFEVELVPPVEVDLSDQLLVRASSTLVRAMLQGGRVADAARILGRPYELEGTVIQGERRGRTIGFPTANLDSAQVYPSDGVYAAWAVLSQGLTLPAAVSVGTKPHFGAAARAVEAYILDLPSPSPSIPGQPEYGWPLRLEFLAFLRDQAAFESLDALLAQIHRDVERVRRITDRARAGLWAGEPEPLPA